MLFQKARKKKKLGRLLTQYKKGFHQEVYDEILSMGNYILHQSIKSDVTAVAGTMMSRVHHNVKVILAHLQAMGYVFGAGFFEEDISQEERSEIEQDAPIYRAPSSETSSDITTLEKKFGFLPLSLKAWYEVVGSVNLIGLFPSNDKKYGVVLDPLFTYSIHMVLKMSSVPEEGSTRNAMFSVPISPDRYFKYGFSGSGNYSIEIPSQSFDAPLSLEKHATTFVNYLRLSMKWGGLPGLEQECRLSKENLAYLTDGVIPF